MRFQITVCIKDHPDQKWEEDYGEGAGNTYIIDDNYPLLNEPIETMQQARKWAETAIERFNATLRPKEPPRELLSVQRLPDPPKPPRPHEWIKISMITQQRGNRYFDIYRCERCQITGKRYGIDHEVTRDSKYRARKYEHCKE